MQPVFVTEIIDIIVAVIIYLAAFALLMRGIIGRFIKVDTGNVNAEPDPDKPECDPENTAKAVHIK